LEKSKKEKKGKNKGYTGELGSETKITTVPGNGARNACWHFLAQSPSMEMESIPSNGARNACWCFLA
jgi:hypothetical protein